MGAVLPFDWFQSNDLMGAVLPFDWVQSKFDPSRVLL